MTWFNMEEATELGWDFRGKSHGDSLYSRGQVATLWMSEEGEWYVTVQPEEEENV